VGAAVDDGAAALFGQLRMRHASDAQLRQALASSEHPGLLSEAASEAGERHLSDTVPDLVRLTANANARVATRAGAALGQIKSATPEVIRALVKMTEGADSEKHLVAIHALADLATPEAKRYLESLAVGHPSPLLREIARGRLRELGTELPPEPEPLPDPGP
jgi:HEAT repeat protein